MISKEVNNKILPKTVGKILKAHILIEKYNNQVRFVGKFINFMKPKGKNFFSFLTEIIL